MKGISLFLVLQLLILIHWIGSLEASRKSSRKGHKGHRDDDRDDDWDHKGPHGRGESEHHEIGTTLESWWSTVSTSYPRYDDTTQLLKSIEKSFPNQVKVYTIGKSVQGREMWVIKLCKNKVRPLLAPPVKIVANMHGDEVLGRALMLMLAVDLLTKFKNKDPRAVKLLETTDLHLMPSMNPDGFEAAPEGECDPNSEVLGRVNANLADLNRDFPDQFVTQGQDLQSLYKGRQQETQNMMKWITSNYFVLSANLHALTLVASYPFDSVSLDQMKVPGYEGVGVLSRSPDHDVFFYLATLYAQNHATMSKYNNCSKGEFKDGVTNGAQWYNVRGGMQDFNYVHSNTFDVTFELSCCKYPPATTLLTEWDNNRESLYKYIEAAQMGVKGIVKNGKRMPISGASISIEGISHDVVTTPNGEYWRLLIPGTYKIFANAQGYSASEPVEVVVPEDSSRLPVRLDIQLVTQRG